MLFLFVSTAAYAQIYVVEEVIDVATLKLTNGETVRLIGVEPPKIEKVFKGNDFAMIARREKKVMDFMKSLDLEGKEVLLSFDVQKKDEQGRLLAYVKVRGLVDIKKDGEVYFEEYNPRQAKTIPTLFLNGHVIKWGYAQPLMFQPNMKYTEYLSHKHQTAFENRRGLYKDLKSSEVPDGTYYEYYPDGKIKLETSYKNGKVFEVKGYDEKGEVVQIVEY